MKHCPISGIRIARLFFLVLLIGILHSKQLVAQKFSASTSAPAVACNWSGNQKEVKINVSGLTSPISACNGVLREVRVQLGTKDGLCKKDLSSYRMELAAPDGTKINLAGSAAVGSTPATAILTTGASLWLNVKFRDHPILKRLRDYPSPLVQANFFPFSIGYYRSQDPFNTFDGKNPNGDWKLTLFKGSASANGISIENVELIFGPPIKAIDLTGDNSNDFCSGAPCMSNGVYIGTNNGYGTEVLNPDGSVTGGDPLYPGNVIGSCDWNSANNNSAWFKFTPTSSSSTLTLSGLLSSCNKSADVQAIIFKGNGCNSGSLIIPQGGCAADISQNNDDYSSANGGGKSGKIYDIGISANIQFKLNGLIIGDDYYLYVDGRRYPGLGSNPACLAQSTFYIEVENAACSSSPCNFTVSGPTTVCASSSPVTYTNNSAAPCGGNWSVVPVVTGTNPGSIAADGKFTPNSSLTSPVQADIRYDAGGGCVKDLRITVSNTPAKPETEYTSPTCTAAGVTKIKASSYNSLYTYTFSPTGPSVGTGGAITGMAVGTEYTVTAKIGTCTSVASEKFKNEPKKNTPPNITNNAISCSGTTGSVTITAPLNPSAGPAQYEYSLGGTTFGSVTTFSGLSNGSYTLVVRDIASTCTTTKNISVSCGCTLSPTITLPSSNASVCSEVPNTVSGIAFSNAGTGGVVVSSDGGGLLKLNGSGSGAATVTANTSPFNVTYTPDASDDGKVITITFKAEQPAGCVTTKEFELTVKPIPAKPVIPATSSPKYYCEGSTVTALSATFLSGVQQNWYGTNATGTPSTTPSTPDVTTSVGSPFIYYVSQTLNGCESDQSEIEVVVTPEIKPVFNPCVTTGSSITFDWDDVPNAASYDITYEVNNSGSPQSGGNVTASTFTTPTPLDPEDVVRIVVTPKPDPSLPAGSTCFAPDEKICQADACTVVTLSGDQDVCIDGSESFTATPSGVGTWSSGNVGIAEIDANGLITPKGKGKVTMTYTLTSPVVGCPDKFPRDITVQPLPLVNAGPDRRLELGSSVVLNGSTDAVSPTIVWSPPVGLSSTTVLKPSAKPQETTEYTLEITSQKGCVSSDKVNVVVIRPVQVPNIFSPNGDGFNDRWIIFNIEDYPNALVQIFNRYGSKVFEQKGYSISNAWNGTNKGTPYPVGAYYYVINLGNGKKPLSGVVSIVK